MKRNLPGWISCYWGELKVQVPQGQSASSVTWKYHLHDSITMTFTRWASWFAAYVCVSSLIRLVWGSDMDLTVQLSLNLEANTEVCRKKQTLSFSQSPESCSVCSPCRAHAAAFVSSAHTRHRVAVPQCNSPLTRHIRQYLMHQGIRGEVFTLVKQPRVPWQAHMTTHITGCC